MRKDEIQGFVNSIRAKSPLELTNGVIDDNVESYLINAYNNHKRTLSYERMRKKGIEPRALVLNLHGGGSIIGMGYPPYLSSVINAEKFGQIFEKIREKLGQPDFKFDTIIMISCLMGNAEFMHTVKDYANYYIGSESSQPVLSWNLSKYIQEVGKGYNSINAGNAILDSFKDMTDNFNLYSDINMVDLTKLEDVSNAFDNMSAALQINYDKGGIDRAKTINNIFLSAYNAVNYGNGQVDLFTFAERLGYNDEYYTDDYTAVKNELQTVDNNA